jgi:hypothetical protein
MSLAARPEIEPGRAYRTRDLRRWGRNPTRLARRLVAEGKLRKAARGLYYAPVPSRFGLVPASNEELLRVFLNGGRFLFTGPPQWNALGLGSTAMFAVHLVYNTQRTGTFVLDRRRFILRRVSFPDEPRPEWFVIDLLQHHEMAGAALSELRRGLVSTLRAGRWDREQLQALAETYGSKATQALVQGALAEAASSA